MRVALLALAVLALAGASAAAPGANVALLFTQEVGALERHDPAPHRYVCAALPDGTSQRKLTPLDGRAVDPDVSPSGTEVAYVSSSAGPFGALERVPTDGGGAVGLASGLVAAWPAWSEDGSRVFFASTGHGGLAADLDLFSVPREGGSPARIVGGPLRESMPASGGGRIVFVRSDPSGPSVSAGELWLVREDGSELRRLGIEGAADPSLSADGTRVAYVAPDGIRTATLDPEGARIGPVLAEGREPALSPDGTRIAFVADGDVWTMALDGGERSNLTSSRIAEAAPTWQPAGARAGGEEPCALVGTPGDDVLTGSASRDVVYDGEGDDVYRTLGGDDVVYDGEGSDRYETGDGCDEVTLVAGSNAVDGGPGPDEIVGSQGPDRVLAGEGDDVVAGLRGADTLFGGPGDDRIQGNRGDDAIDGGLGDDVLFGGLISGLPREYDGYDVVLGRGGNDRIAGGWQKDRIFGGPGRDRLRGGPHADHLVGEAGADDVAGESGDDLLLARDAARDVVSGGPGFDRAALDAVDRRGGIERLLR